MNSKERKDRANVKINPWWRKTFEQGTSSTATTEYPPEIFFDTGNFKLPDILIYE